MLSAPPTRARRLLRPWLGPPWRGFLRLRSQVLVTWPAEVSGWRARGRNPSQKVACWPGPDAPLGPDVAVLVHFDPAGQVRSRVRRYLAALREAGLSVVVASNAGALQRSDEAALRGLADGYLVRRNVGYDFGAMREALAHWRLPRPDTRRVLLLNDSVLGPFAPLAPLLDRIDFSQADLWGATDSPQRAYHLQSFFLAAGPAALFHPGWNAFWESVRPSRSKEFVIGHYEIGLTQSLLGHGLRARALFPYDELVSRLSRTRAVSLAQLRQHARSRAIVESGGDLNPTAHLWRELLEAGFPFVKRELVGRNPAGILDAGEWGDAAGCVRPDEWA